VTWPWVTLLDWDPSLNWVEFCCNFAPRPDIWRCEISFLSRTWESLIGLASSMLLYMFETVVGSCCWDRCKVLSDDLSPLLEAGLASFFCLTWFWCFEIALVSTDLTLSKVLI
jgi:hypothetical protein